MVRILSINPGSTSTKVAVFDEETEIFELSISHDQKTINTFKRIVDQVDFRLAIINEELIKAGIELESLSAVVGRGGLVRPIPSGTYLVNEQMINDLHENKNGEHASNLGAILADKIAAPLGIPAYMVDPVVVDELDDVARLSGHPLLPRVSILHALNQKAVGRRYAKECGKKYEELHLIVAHLGGGISVSAHKKGRMIDTNNALSGDGPFSPERAGGIPSYSLVKLCFDGKYSEEEVLRMLVGKGGYVSYLGTNDGREVSKRIAQGDKEAALVQEALAYQVSKEIGANAAVLCGEVDAIILTGGLAYNRELTDYIVDHVSFIAPVTLYPGENEMEALNQGGLRVLLGEESAKEYA